VDDVGNLMAMNQALKKFHIGHTALLALNCLTSDTVQALQNRRLAL
jgi:hypothetical protein